MALDHEIELADLLQLALGRLHAMRDLGLALAASAQPHAQLGNGDVDKNRAHAFREERVARRRPLEIFHALHIDVDDQAAARRELAAINAMLAESSRIAERLRISRELHDALGHHLTALALNLEAALHRTGSESRARLETAQKLAKSLLGDVRNIASAMQSGTALDLEKVLRPLIDDVPRPRVHLEVADGIRVEDPERANIVVRCTQEIVTNAAKHSSAENLWIVIGREGNVVRIHARDDGRGAAQTTEGFGLRSMRDRVEGAGGELRVDAHPGTGFEVVARVPA